MAAAAEANKELFRCQKCGKMMVGTNFFTYKTGEKVELCKKCLTMHVDNFDPNTYLWILEKMDVPYIPQEWNIIRDKAYAKDPKKMDGTSVMGKYLSKMRLKTFLNYGWKDSDLLQERYAETDKKAQETKKKFEEEITAQYESGKITEAEYRTLVGADVQHEKDEEEFVFEIPTEPVVGENNLYDEKEFVAEEELVDLGAELTEEDRLYLAMKWGRLYRPNEWVELENKYNEMMGSFDIQDSDTIGTLIIICKTYLKMNQAIDCGDIEGFQKLSRVYDTLRKSAKFTAAQNKDQKDDFVDSVGEIVAYCEKNGGQIPVFEIEEPADVIDVIIKDLKEYNKKLIYEDTALSRQIEDYLKKKQISEEMEKDKQEAQQNNKEGRELTDNDYLEYFAQQEYERMNDAETIGDAQPQADTSAADSSLEKGAEKE